MSIKFKGPIGQVNVNEGTAPQNIIQYNAMPDDTRNAVRSRLDEIRAAVESLSPERRAELQAALSELIAAEEHPVVLQEKALSLRERLTAAGRDYGAVRGAVSNGMDSSSPYNPASRRQNGKCELPFARTRRSPR